MTQCAAPFSFCQPMGASSWRMGCCTTPYYRIPVIRQAPTAAAPPRAEGNETASPALADRSRRPSGPRRLRRSHGAPVTGADGGNEITGDDGGKDVGASSDGPSSSDSAVPHEDANSGEPGVACSLGTTGVAGGGGSCKVNSSETCSDGTTYAVECSCPTATCSCSESSGHGDPRAEAFPSRGARDLQFHCRQSRLRILRISALAHSARRALSSLRMRSRERPSRKTVRRARVAPRPVECSIAAAGQDLPVGAGAKGHVRGHRRRGHAKLARVRRHACSPPSDERTAHNVGEPCDGGVCISDDGKSRGPAGEGPSAQPTWLISETGNTHDAVWLAASGTPTSSRRRISVASRVASSAASCWPKSLRSKPRLSRLVPKSGRNVSGSALASERKASTASRVASSAASRWPKSLRRTPRLLSSVARSGRNASGRD